MARYPAQTTLLASAAPVVTFVEWNLLYASFALVAVGALLGLVDVGRRRRGRAGPEQG
jgi:hypothetical protein